jgi:hypothetical protein
MNDTDKKAQQFAALIDQTIGDLKKLCLNNKAPMFVTVYLPEQKKYVSDMVSPKVLGIEITPNHIIGHLNVANGFHTVLPIESIHQIADNKGDVSELDFTEMITDCDFDDTE